LQQNFEVFKMGNRGAARGAKPLFPTVQRGFAPRKPTAKD